MVLFFIYIRHVHYFISLFFYHFSNFLISIILLIFAVSAQTVHSNNVSYSLCNSLRDFLPSGSCNTCIFPFEIFSVPTMPSSLQPNHYSIFLYPTYYPLYFEISSSHCSVFIYSNANPSCPTPSNTISYSNSLISSNLVWTMFSSFHLSFFSLPFHNLYFSFHTGI